MFTKYIYVSAVLFITLPYLGVGAWYLVSSCPAPCAEPRGLNAPGVYLVGDGPIPQIFVINPKTGSVGSSFPAPGGPGAWGITGIPPVEDYLYLSNYLTSWIYKITTTGSVLSSFLCPLPGPAGIDYGGWPLRLEVTIPNMNVVAALDLEEGYLISAFRGPGLKPTSCVGDNWAFVGDAGTHTIYVRIFRDPIITGIEIPSGISVYNYIKDTEPDMGLYVVDAATKYIYNYEDNAPVAPSSLGRIKALFE